MKAMVKASLLGLVVLGASCSSGAEDSLAGNTEAIEAADSVAPQDAAAATTTTQKPAPTTAQPAEAEIEDAEAAVRAAFEEYRAVVRELVTAPDDDLAGLDEVAQGAAFALIEEAVRERISSGTLTAFPEPSLASDSISSVTVSGPESQLVVCVVDDSFRVDLETGAISNEGLAARLEAYQLVLSDRWRVSDSVLVDRWPGASDCDT